MPGSAPGLLQRLLQKAPRRPSARRVVDAGYRVLDNMNAKPKLARATIVKTAEPCSSLRLPGLPALRAANSNVTGACAALFHRVPPFPPYGALQSAARSR